MNIQEYLKENLPELKKAIENKLELKLGKVNIKPVYSLIEDLEGRKHSTIEKILIYPGLFLNALENGSMMVNNKFPQNIYASHFSIFKFNKNKKLQGMLHELTHLAHLKIINKNKEHPSVKSEKLREGFAEYISGKILKDYFNIEPKNIAPSYKEYYELFKKEIEKKNLKTADDFKKYLINYKGN